MFYYIHPEKNDFFCRKSAPYRVADPIGGILTFLRKIFAPYRVGGLYLIFGISGIFRDLSLGFLFFEYGIGINFANLGFEIHYDNIWDSGIPDNRPKFFYLSFGLQYSANY